MRNVLAVGLLPEWAEAVAIVKPAYDYIEDRITGACQEIYDASEQYARFEAMRVFNPALMAGRMDATFVDKLKVVPQLRVLVPQLHLELAEYARALYDVRHKVPSYKASKAAETSVRDFTKEVLAWWKESTRNRCGFPTWAKAARIVFSVPPTSASCERVFSLLKTMFGDLQLRAMYDYLQAALMLSFNKRLK